MNNTSIFNLLVDANKRYAGRNEVFCLNSKNWICIKELNEVFFSEGCVILRQANEEKFKTNFIKIYVCIYKNGDWAEKR